MVMVPERMRGTIEEIYGTVKESGRLTFFLQRRMLTETRGL
jgi:hypothetical protein